MATALTPQSAIAYSAQQQFGNWVVGNCNAGDGAVPNRVYFLLQRSEMLGQGLPGAAAAFPVSLGSRAGGLAVCCSGPEVHLGALSGSCSSDWYLVDRILPTRSSSVFSQKRPGIRSRARIVKCVGASAGAGGVDLKPLLDQVLLLGTVFGVYIAGVASLPRLPQLLPNRRPSSARRDTATSQKSAKRDSIWKQKPKPRSPESSGEDSWSLLRSKLSQAISMKATEEDDEKVVKTPKLGLQAIARVPRLQLLLTTLQHLRKEVEAIPDDQRNLDLVQWQELSLSVLSRSVAPICRSWIHDEYLSEDVGNSHQVELNMMGILKDSESIPSYVSRSGKAGLYADLIFFLRFGSARVGGCCDHRVFKKYTGNVLEDMVVAIAEVVATLFLDCSSVSSLSPHGEMWQTLLLPSILSSRSLERFRNQVALYGWLNQNFASVAAMFEDRFDLWTLQRRLTPVARRELEKSSTKKPVKMVIVGGADDLVLTPSQLPARRSIELRVLTGWRYYYSLFLELSDVVGPLMSILLSKAGDVVSFLLITLIGRSLGLVYQGIRQSVWPINQKKDRSAKPV